MSDLSRLPSIVNLSQGYGWGPTVDNVFLLDQPTRLIQHGGLAGMDILWGANTNDSAGHEYPQFINRTEYIEVLNNSIHGHQEAMHKQRPENVSRYNEYMARYTDHIHRRSIPTRLSDSRAPQTLVGDDLLQRALQLYPPHSNVTESNDMLMGWFQSDKFLCDTQRQVLAAATTGKAQHAYVYRFDWFFQSTSTCTADSNYHEPKYGSNHCDEMTFVFGQPVFDSGYPPGDGFTNCSDPSSAYYDKTCEGCAFNPSEAKFANDVGRYWSTFARGEALPGWPSVVNASVDPGIVLRPMADNTGYVIENTMGRPEACAFWAEVATYSGGL